MKYVDSGADMVLNLDEVGNEEAALLSDSLPVLSGSSARRCDK